MTNSDASVPVPCNPWGGVVGDDLSFATPNSFSARRDDDPKKLSSNQQSDDMSSVGRQPWSNVWFDTSVMVKSTSEMA